MTRKARQPNNLELVRERSAADTLEDERVTVHRLTGEQQQTLDAIITGCALAAQAPAPPAILTTGDDDLLDLDDELDDDELDDDDIDDGSLDDESPEALDDEVVDELDAAPNVLANLVGAVTFTTRILARALLARALDRHPAPVAPSADDAANGTDDPIDGVVLDELAHALLPPSLPDSIRPSRADRKAAFEDAGSLIREVGLEEFDVSCSVGTAGDGAFELFTSALTPESAHISLLEFLFDRAETFVAEVDPLLSVERDASSWEFSRWSVAPPPGRGSTEMAAFARTVREQEYSLAERRTIALGIPVLGELAGDERYAELFPRQHRMAGALAASFVDVFECLTIHESRITLRSLSNGRKYQVHEHMEPIDYARGWIAAGRLYPFDGEVHLRSPGMIFFQAEDPEFLATAVRTLASAHDRLPPALALEQFISSVVFDVAVPRVMKPASSRAEAREVLATIQDVLADVEVDREMEREAEIKPDSTLDGFMTALADQAKAGRPR